MKRLRRVTALLLSLCLCVLLLPPASAAQVYSDVPEDHWAAEQILRARELGLLRGTGGGVFGLGLPISRAEFVTALGRLMRWESVSPDMPSYPDVPRDAWYYAAVETALAQGAVLSLEASFRPDDPVTREEMASMLIRALGYTSLAVVASQFDSHFSDVSVNMGYITLVYDLGLMRGTETGVFSPEEVTPREQAAVVLVRAYDKLYGESRQVYETGGGRAVSVETPQAADGQELPLTPLEPIAELYSALRQEAGNSGAVLFLTGGGVRTITTQGKIAETEILTAQEVAELLAQSTTREYYSQRYESAYCIYAPNSYQSATVWFQSERSLNAKVRLARFFGVTEYYLM